MTVRVRFIGRGVPIVEASTIVTFVAATAADIAGCQDSTTGNC
ncbi:MAG TPA: hypothetical protein VII75_00280 [Thermoanaerobaculia bacterium]